MISKRIAIVAMVAGAASTSGCSDFLDAENPAAIEGENLTGAPAYALLLHNGAVGTFQAAFPQLVIYGSTFSDESRNHHVFFENRDIDMRRVLPENGTVSIFMYTPLHRSRFVADSGSQTYKTIVGADSAAKDVRYARMRAIAGYAYVLLAETMCTSPVNGSRPYTPTELFKDWALPRFQEAITVARAARAAPNASTGTRATADSIIMMASIGGARAALGANVPATAIALASDPLILADSARGWTWKWNVNYSTNTAGENNPVWAVMAAEVGSGSRTLSISSTPFQPVRDIRIPHPDTTESMQNAIRAIVANSPSAYSTWSATDTLGVELTATASIRVASTLEARYIIAEARSAPTAPGAIDPADSAFIESRRRIARDALVPVTTSANFITNLMEERARDFFLDNHRLGDLRRFKERYGIDRWQTGSYPGSTSGEMYGTQECFPLPLSEINGNPNVPKP